MSSAEQKLKSIVEKRRQGIKEPLPKQDIDAYLREMIDAFITPYSIAARPEDVYPIEVRDVIHYLLRKMTLLACAELTGAPVMGGNVVSIERRTMEVAIERIEKMTRAERAIGDKELREQEEMLLRLADLSFEMAKRYNFQCEERDKERISAYGIIGAAIHGLRCGCYNEQKQ